MNKRPDGRGFIDKLYFKPTDKGWLFKEPGFWKRRTYCLTDAQRMQLLGPVRWMTLVTIVVVVAGIQLPHIASDRLHVPPWLAMTTSIVLVLIVFWIYLAGFFRPKLSGLTPTDDRITFSDQFQMQAKGLPRGLVILFLLCCLGFVILGLAMSFVDGWHFETAFSIAFFSMLGAYPVALLFLRRTP
jgi:hypothetical protein